MNSRLEKTSSAVSKRIEKHVFEDEEGEEYKASNFGGFADYFRRKKIKLQNLDVDLRARSADKPQIFRGVVAHINGYTQPSLNDLHHLIVAHGGGFLQYLDGKTMATHVIASNLTPKKVVEFKRYRIVKPAWIVDSVKAGKLLPWNSYRLTSEGDRQKVLQFNNGKITAERNSPSKGYREQSDASWYNQQFKDLNENSGSQLQTSGEASSLDPDAVEELFEKLEKPEDAGQADESSQSDSQEHSHEDVESPDEQGQLYDDLLGDEPVEKNPPPLRDSSMGDILDFDNDGNDDAREIAEQSSPKAGPDVLKRKVEPFEQPEPAKKQKLMSAEEHNAVLLSDPHIRKASALNPEFLEQYYRESRLHHLSTWKAELKSRLQALTAKLSPSQRTQPRRPTGARRYILHVDFDSFFVAVSLKSRPELADKPACVAHGRGSGSEIASCNYPARKFGVKNGMWMKKALGLCKDLEVIPYDFPAYEEASKLFYEAILATGGIVQSVSIDEALVDVTSMCLEAGVSDGTGIKEGSIRREQDKADEISQNLRDQIKESTGCNVSVGIGGNVLLAKVALRKAKPAGQHQIKPEEVLEFLAPLQVQNLPGIAYSIGGKLEEHDIKLVKDIREVTKERLVSILGPKTGEKIWNYSRGIDQTEVGDQSVRKSVSAEINWGIRFETQEQAEEFLESLCGEVNRRLLKEQVKGQQMTMKIMRRAADAPLDPPKHLGHGRCDTFNKSVPLGVSTNSKDIIAKHAISILRSYNFSPGELRGLGVQITKLEPLKGSGKEETGGSQKRLQFKIDQSKPPPHTSQTESKDDPIQDLPETPRKPKSQLTSSVSIKPIGYSPNEDSPGRRKPLNILGTQFLLPSQVDAEVLAELPPDIRSRLVQQGKSSIDKDNHLQHHGPTTSAAEETEPAGAAVVPSESQLDPEALAALPEDLRTEILAEYRQQRRAPSNQTAKNLSDSRTKPASPQYSILKAAANQTLLPQSPRKNHTVTFAAAPSRAPRGRPRGGSVAAGGGSSLISRLRAASNNNTLTQSNFVKPQPAARNGVDHNTHANNNDKDPDAPSEEFLAALPDDIREEVLGQHRAEQIRRRGGLVFHKKRRGRKPFRLAENNRPAQPPGPRREIVVTLPRRPARPTFTVRKLWRAEDLRDAISAWYTAFQDDGPYDEDVVALGKYLCLVVESKEDEGEGDLDKAVKIVKWIDFVVETNSNSHSNSAAAAGAIDSAVDGAVDDNDDDSNDEISDDSDGDNADDDADNDTADNGDGNTSDDDEMELEKGKASKEPAQLKWNKALERIKCMVQDAVLARGLGAVDL